jgi:hypothetical protein
MVDDAEWEMILKEVDINGDGEISYEEFTEMILRLFGLQISFPQKRGLKWSVHILKMQLTR